MIKNKLKLKMVLIPTTMWYISLYNLLRKNKLSYEWKNIKQELFINEGKKCYICNKENEMLSAHEFWTYNEREKIQKLKEIHHLCILCHMIQHYGFSTMTESGIEFLKSHGYKPKELINHFCKVNRCSKKDFEIHSKQAFKIQSKRSKIKWKQDWGKYGYLMKLLESKGVKVNEQ